jgi:hypothetical protein
MIEDKVHIQHMPRQEMVETLMQPQHLTELKNLFQNRHAEEIAVTLEVLDKDSRFLFGHRLRNSWPITTYVKFRIPALNNWLATERLVLMRAEFVLAVERYCGPPVPSIGLGGTFRRPLL